MYQPPHLKYRPQTLSELVGQESIHKTLNSAISTKRIAQAYLFTGPRGTGKTSTARILAKSLNCLEAKEPTITPCGKCVSCRNIASSSALDVSEIDAASHNGVDYARQLIENSQFAPAQGRYRIFILDECHQLSTSAQNTLLKIIEEPPAKVIFILCTTEVHKVLPTITSRCQIFNFKALSNQTVVEHLKWIAQEEKIKITDKALTVIASSANGGLRDALQLLSQLSLLDSEINLEQVTEISGGISPQELTELITTINTKETIQLLTLCRHLIDSGKTPKLIFGDLLQVYRDLLLVKSESKCRSLIHTAITYKQLKDIAKQTTWETLYGQLTQLQKSEAQLKGSINQGVWLEVCLLNLLNLSPDTTKEDQVDLSQTWDKVLKAAQPKSKKLLRQARLTKLEDEQAVLRVEPKYYQKFVHSRSVVERIISRALGYSVTATIEEGGV